MRDFLPDKQAVTFDTAIIKVCKYRVYLFKTVYYIPILTPRLRKCTTLCAKKNNSYLQN